MFVLQRHIFYIHAHTHTHKQKESHTYKTFNFFVREDKSFHRLAIQLWGVCDYISILNIGEYITENYNCTKAGEIWMSIDR